MTREEWGTQIAMWAKHGRHIMAMELTALLADWQASEARERSERMAQTAQDRKVYQAAWYQKNKKKVQETQAAWRTKHPGWSTEYARRNVFTVRAHAADWREAHREEIREYQRRYYREKTVPKRQIPREE